MGLVTRLAGAAAPAEATAAEYRRLVDAPTTADDVWQRCVLDMGLSEEPCTPSEQQRREIESALERCCRDVRTSLEDLQQHWWRHGGAACAEASAVGGKLLWPVCAGMLLQQRRLHQHADGQ
jgi:hypothetical protein